ncbi:MAG: hypothetical protein JHC39_11550 [Lentimicrobium sp.]|nr:hypothetical protein [Lentimicrobium sp.]
MNVITNRPIYQNPNGVSDNFELEDQFYNENDLDEYTSFEDDFSNACGCSGCSGIDGEFSNACGCSGFDGEYFNAVGDEDKKTKTPSKIKTWLSKIKASSQKRIADRRSKRKLARLDKKPKKNAKKLRVFKKKDGDPTERYLFDLSKLKRGAKKKKDGTVAEVKKEDTAVVTNKATGEKVEIDKREVANATGIPEAKLTPEVIQKVVVINPETKEVSIEVPEKLVEMANDGEVYVSTDIQDVEEETKDVDDKSLSKTQKIVLWSVGGVALLIIGYLVYKAVSKTPTK